MNFKPMTHTKYYNGVARIRKVHNTYHTVTQLAKICKLSKKTVARIWEAMHSDEYCLHETHAIRDENGARMFMITGAD